ncbi:CaiB/BaiF family protein [Corchorus olitorius]|uniref:CaiB/BaiF family protein n=1 Tax=Corchorus olitorius TaxID=93759 RepID=A0A1R3H2Y4_9ROSI|nr:CaiB/BaiF family protein [Corchorus olitorius]
MESISVKKTIQTRVHDNPLRNPISNLSQWNALKAQDYDNNDGDEIVSYRHPKASNPLLKPISNLQGWRALIAEDTESKEFDEEVVASNPLMKPISNLQEWRALIAQETESLTKAKRFTSEELDEKLAVNVSLSS